MAAIQAGGENCHHSEAVAHLAIAVDAAIVAGDDDPIGRNGSVPQPTLRS